MEEPGSESAGARQKEQSFGEWAREQADRALENYQRYLGLTQDYLRNRKILDVGAAGARFAAACNWREINKNVYSIDPEFDKRRAAPGTGQADTRFMEALPDRVRAEVKKRMAAAVGEQLPFQDQSFDLVLAQSVPYGEDAQKLEERLRELLRVGKEVRVFPVRSSPDGEVPFFSRAVFEDILARMGKEIPLEAEFREIPGAQQTRILPDGRKLREIHYTLIIKRKIPS